MILTGIRLKNQIVITTNFDQNIELALKEEGLVEGDDFRVVYDLIDFEYASCKDKPLVLKLHGSIVDEQSIITTISRIVRKDNIELVELTLRQILNDKDFDDLVVIGYSFSRPI